VVVWVARRNWGDRNKPNSKGSPGQKVSKKEGWGRKKLQRHTKNVEWPGNSTDPGEQKSKTKKKEKDTGKRR